MTFDLEQLYTMIMIIISVVVLAVLYIVDRKHSKDKFVQRLLRHQEIFITHIAQVAVCVIMIVAFMNSGKVDVSVILQNTVLSILSISGSHYFYLLYIGKMSVVESYKSIVEIVEYFFLGTVFMKFIENRIGPNMIYINAIYLVLTVVLSFVALKQVKKVKQDYVSTL